MKPAQLLQISTPTSSAYKDAYNRHRRRPQRPNYIGDFDDLVDFSNPSSDSRIVPLHLLCPNDNHFQSNDDNDTAGAGSHDTTNYNHSHNNDDKNQQARYKGPTFGITTHPGFVYIPHALSKRIQMDLAHESLTQFCNDPHGTNIDLVPMKQNEIVNGPNESMWNLWKQDHCYAVNDHVNASNLNVSINATNNGIASDSIDSLETKQEYPLKRNTYKSFEKLSWATTGYHYDWTKRSYKEDRKSPMPPSMTALGSLFAECDSSQSKSQLQLQPFTTAASIVNYYSKKSTMGGHRDDLELDFTKPVVSISLGLPAVFLLGGKTKEEEPVIGILVRPGDVMLLAGDSRLCYHGMARVIPKYVALPEVDVALEKHASMFQIDSWGDDCFSGDDNYVKKCTLVKRDLTTPECDVDAVCDFLSEHRININLRQVLPHGMDRIP